MGDPFKPHRVKFEEFSPHAADRLQERVSLLGYSLADYEALVEAFGDPDIDETAAMLYSTGDSALRALVAAAKGENPNGYVPPALANHPTVESDEFDIGWSVKALLDYVGSDEERALAVYVAEADKAEPRSTLVDKLGRMLGVDG